MASTFDYQDASLSIKNRDEMLLFIDLRGIKSAIKGGGRVIKPLRVRKSAKIHELMQMLKTLLELPEHTNLTIVGSKKSVVDDLGLRHLDTLKLSAPCLQGGMMQSTADEAVIEEL